MFCLDGLCSGWGRGHGVTMVVSEDSNEARLMQLSPNERSRALDARRIGPSPGIWICRVTPCNGLFGSSFDAVLDTPRDSERRILSEYLLIGLSLPSLFRLLWYSVGEPFFIGLRLPCRFTIWGWKLFTSPLVSAAFLRSARARCSFNHSSILCLNLGRSTKPPY